MSATYANWSSVTLAEYAALDIIRRDNAEQLLNGYWDELHASGRVIVASDSEPSEPTRLTHAGSEWLAGLHRTVVTTLDEHELIASARKFVKSMGTLLTVNVARAVADNEHGYTTTGQR